MFGQLKSLFLGIAAIIAIIPGASLLAGFITLPPDFNELVGFVASIVGPMTFLLVYLARDRLVNLSRRVLIGLVTACTVGGLAATVWLYQYGTERITSYSWIEGATIHTYEFVLPETYGPELKNKVEREAGSIHRVLDRYHTDRPAIFRWLATDARPVIWKLAVGFALAQALFLFAFLTAAWTAIAAAARSGDAIDTIDPAEPTGPELDSPEAS